MSLSLATVLILAMSAGSCGSSTEPVTSDGQFNAFILHGVKRADFSGKASYSIGGAPSVELVPDLDPSKARPSVIWAAYLTFPRGVRPKAGDVFPLAGGSPTQSLGRGELTQFGLSDAVGAEHEWTTTSGELRVQSVGGSVLVGTFTLAVLGVNTGNQALVTGSFRAQCATYILSECS